MASLSALLLVFAVIGGIELLDRSNFALLGLAARQPPRPTWGGAAAAFLATSAIAVAVGTVLLAALGPELRYIEAAGGILILAFATHLALAPDEPAPPETPRSAFATAFVLIFLLELGDTTQILLVLFTGSLKDPIGVFLAGSAGLLGVAAFASWAGAKLGARVPPRVLNRAVVAILIVVGSITLLVAAVPALFAGVPI